MTLYLIGRCNPLVRCGGQERLYILLLTMVTAGPGKGQEKGRFKVHHQREPRPPYKFKVHDQIATPTHHHIRVHDVDGHMHEIRDEVHVTLCPSPSTLGTEGLLVGEPQQQQPKVVHQEVVGVVKQSGTFLDEVIVTGQGAGEVGL